MTLKIEDVKKFLKENSEGKELVKELTSGSVEKLETKNGELIAANKKLKKERDENSSKITEYEEELEELKKSNGSQDFDAKLEKETKKLTKEITDLKSQNENLKRESENDLIERSLSSALVKANISSEHFDAVEALLKSKNKMVVDETDREVKVGDKSLNEFVTEWSQGDVGKRYVAVKTNTGGGAGGSGKGGTGNEDLLKMSAKEKISYGLQNNK